MDSAVPLSVLGMAMTAATQLVMQSNNKVNQELVQILDLMK